MQRNEPVGHVTVVGHDNKFDEQAPDGHLIKPRAQSIGLNAVELELPEPDEPDEPDELDAVEHNSIDNAHVLASGHNNGLF
jgi:hypothetical protein